jgi:phosphoglycolate phosphatase-like HAD superfamily hydrolase
MLNTIKRHRPEKTPAEQVRALVAHWRTQYSDPAELRARARRLAVALAEDLRHGAPVDEVHDMLAELEVIL